MSGKIMVCYHFKTTRKIFFNCKSFVSSEMTAVFFLIISCSQSLEMKYASWPVVTKASVSPNQVSVA